VVAGRFWFATYRSTVALPPFWALRAMTMELGGVVDFAPFVAGVAAWMGSREGRRHTTEMVAVTVRPRWTAQLATWSATLGWAMAAYLGCVAVLYVVTARHAAWGGPLWWPVAVGAAAVAAPCAAGFAAGALFPSRFTAPLAAVVVFVALFASLHPASNSTYALISPANSSVGLNLAADIGIFYPYLPDLAIAQVMFLAGLAVAALGALGLPAAAGGRWLRSGAAIITAAGLVAAGTGVGLAGTARRGAHGMMVIPALHDAASDRPVPYTPVCSHSAVPVCLHPAFRAYLPDVTAALGPVLSQVAGLPGTPVRVTQVAANELDQATGGETISGSPPVLGLPLGFYLPPGLPPAIPLTQWMQSKAAPVIVNNVIGGGTPGASPAQQAIEAALLKAAGLPLLTPTLNHQGGGPVDGVAGPTPGSPAYAAAMRFAALPAATRHAWVAAHLASLRAGHITLAQLP
jgi:hypothetical protein